MPSQRLAFVLILIAATLVRLVQVNAQSLSMDELKDLETARGGWSTIQGAENRFPPLYHVLLCAWLQAIPVDADGRGFSVLCGVLAVAAVGRLGRVVGGDKTELWAAALAAVAPLAVWYSVEVRAYSLYFLCGAVALWKFTAALIDGRRWDWIAFAAAALAGVYTHYYFGLLIAIAGLLFLASRPRRDQLVTGLATFAVIGVGCLPALALLRGDLDQPWGFARTSDFTAGGLVYTYFSYLAGYSLGPSLRELHTATVRDSALTAAPWAALVGAPTLVLLIQATAAYAPQDRRRWVIWFVAFGLAPAATIGAVSHFAGFGYNVRHTAWACAAIWAMVAHGAAHGRPRWLAWSMAVMLAAAFGLANYNRVFSDAHRNEDVRATAQYLQSQQAPSPTFVLSGYMSKPLSHYLPADWPVISLPAAGPDEDLAKLATDAIRENVQLGDSFWLVYTREFHGDPHGAAIEAIGADFTLEREHDFAGVVLYRGRRQ